MPGYMCVVPGCKSGSKVPGHAFPKDPIRALKWKEVINSPRLDGLLEEETRKFYVCALHFTQDDVISTLVRRKLKHDAVPSLLLPKRHHVHDMEDVAEELGTDLQEEMDADFQKDDTTLNLQEKNKEAEAEIKLSRIMPLISVTPQGWKNVLQHKKIQPNMTPRAKQFYDIAKAWRKQQYNSCRKIKTFKMRLALAKKFIKDQNLMKYKKLSPAQQLFVQMQLCNVNKKEKGRRFSTSEKILALSIMKQSGTSYRLLSDLFTLPSWSTLNELLRKISLDTGINPVIMAHLTKAVSEMKDARNKYCLLMWDEVPLEPHISYDAKYDKIIGFEDWQQRRTNKFADHALVFMLRGLFTVWKIPIAYFFCEHQTTSQQLMKCIRDVTCAVTETGLKIVATICNQGSSNRQAINKLLLQTARQRSTIGEPDRRTIDINRVELIPLYDPPHLIKCIRNNLLTKDLEANVGKDTANREIASWRVVMLAYEIDRNTNVLNCQLEKITEDHVVPSKIKKICVKYATQVFSKQMSSYIEFLTNIKGSYHIETRVGPKVMPKAGGRATARILNFFNNLMDSVNGHDVRPETPLRVAITRNSPHHKFWEEALRELRNMQYVDSNTHERIRPQPSLQNWIHTISGFQRLWTLVSNAGFKNLKPRYVNQDPLENFFSKIRSVGGRNNNLTCDQFIDAFKVLFVNNLTSRKTIGKNCENICDGTMLFTLQQFLEDIDNQQVYPPLEDNFDDVPVLEQKVIIPEEERAMMQNDMADHISWKALSLDVVRNCFHCKTSFFRPRIAADKESNFDKITQKVQFALHSYVPTICFKRKISIQLQKKIQEELGTSWSLCKVHLNTLNKFLTPEIEKYYMKHFYKCVNGILSGKEKTLPLENNIFRRAVSKYKKRLHTRKSEL